MPASTTAEPMGHRHTASNSSRRHTSAIWTPQDDEKLRNARQQNLNWNTIAEKFFPTKTPNACRKRHERLMERITANGTWDGPKYEEVAKAYWELREDMWKMLADRVNERWNVVESKCMERGFKNLASMGRAASRKGRSPQNGEVDYEVNRDDGLAIDTHSENEAAVEEPHPFSAFSSSSRRATMSNNVSPASFTSPLPSLPNISEGFSHSFSSTSLPGISSIVGPNNLPVTTR